MAAFDCCSVFFFNGLVGFTNILQVLNHFLGGRDNGMLKFLNSSIYQFDICLRENQKDAPEKKLGLLDVVNQNFQPKLAKELKVQVVPRS